MDRKDSARESHALFRVVGIASAFAAMFLVGMFLLVAGCRPASRHPESADAETAHADHAHADHGHDDHGHSHGHGHDAEGPHGGHIVELGDEQLHAEWTHQDASGELVVYLLDSSARADAAIAAESVTITTKIGEAEKAYELPAVSSTDGKASRFSLTDPALVEALKAVGPGIEAAISVQTEEGPLSGVFERHEHGGHEH